MSTTPMTITLTIHVHPDQSTSSVSPASPPSSSAPGAPGSASEPATPMSGVDAPTVTVEDADALSPAAWLARCRVKNPADLLAMGSTERVIAVCKAALAAPRKNTGGWVATALRKGWAVPGSPSPETTQTTEGPSIGDG